jgi:hypothetical protein
MDALCILLCVFTADVVACMALESWLYERDC